MDLIIVAGVALYCLAAWASPRKPGRMQIACFGLAVVLLIGVLSGPLERLALDRSFTAYIFQQLMLVMAVAPLLLLGIPDWMLRPLLANRIVAPIWRQLTQPVTAIIAYSVMFALIHYPSLCDRVCHSLTFYHGIRAMLVFAGVVVWWPVLSTMEEFPRLPEAAQILYFFVLMVPMVAIGAPITFSRSVLYSFYRQGPHPFGMTPLADQSLGGILMWVGWDMFVLVLMSVIFLRWAVRSERQDRMKVVYPNRGADLGPIAHGGLVRTPDSTKK